MANYLQADIDNATITCIKIEETVGVEERITYKINVMFDQSVLGIVLSGAQDESTLLGQITTICLNSAKPVYSITETDLDVRALAE